MSGLREHQVDVNGHPCRVWEKGAERDKPLGYLAGLLGLPRWTPFLDRLAESRRVIAPSLPGFPGASGHDELDELLDWITATLDLLERSGLEGADLVGVSLGGALAAEVAALSPTSVHRLALAAPLGMFDPEEPVCDVWAQPPGARPELAHRAEVVEELCAPPDGVDAVEWQIEMVRASEAAARLLWPLCDLRIDRRLHRIRAQTLILWGTEDRIVPPGYAQRYAAGIGDGATVRTLEAAGHLLDLDVPGAAAEAILEFLM